MDILLLGIYFYLYEVEWCWWRSRDKIKGCGKFKVVGNFEGIELEIYGNLSIIGYL